MLKKFSIFERTVIFWLFLITLSRGNNYSIKYVERMYKCLQRIFYIFWKMYKSFRQNMFYFERVTIVADFKHASLLKINSEI